MTRSERSLGEAIQLIQVTRDWLQSHGYWQNIALDGGSTNLLQQIARPWCGHCEKDHQNGVCLFP